MASKILVFSSYWMIVRVRFYDNQGKPIFKEPMLRITNYHIDETATAQFVYQLYLQRSEIEVRYYCL
jgi:hypothetical protein